jgi:hypothetical protein
MQTSTTRRSVTFPTAAVEAALRALLRASVLRELELHGMAIPAPGQDLNGLSVEIDSLEVVDLLCDLDGILGFEVGEGVVKAGGYGTIDQAIADLLPKLFREWQKRQRGQT